MTERDAQINQLIQEACSYPPGSKERNRRLDRVIRLIRPRLWRESVPYYADALQQTWLYFSHNICEAGTTNPYDPSRGNVVTWLNAYLQRRLMDGYIRQRDDRSRYASNYGFRDKQSGEYGDADPIAQLPAEPEPLPLLEMTLEWVKTDATGVLRSLSIEGHPHVTAQVLILRRLPPEESLRSLSEEFGIPLSTLSSFYQRKCKPLLRKFAKDEGLI
jgi:hypothetical protein